MTIPKFDERRSAAIRVGLVDIVQGDERPRRAWTGIAAFALAGVLTGGVVSAAVAVATRPPIANLDGTVQEGNPGITAPAGVLPGAPVVALLGNSTTEVFSGSGTATLTPPVGATHVRVTFTCLAPGSLSWGIDSDGNRPSLVCDASDIGPALQTWEDIPLETNGVLELSGTATYTVSVQYLTKIETAWGVNDRGETYGVAKPGFGEPDLLAAIGEDAQGRETLGYVRTEELGGTSYSSPGEAAHSNPDGSKTIPLLAPDGITQIGIFIDGA